MPYKHIATIVLLFMLLPILAIAQSDWKQATSKNGKVRITYKLETVKGRDGSERVMAQYIAKGLVPVQLASAEKFLRNSANYKHFLDNTEVSKTVDTINANEWLLYLMMDIPWPMPDADCVQQVSVTKTEKELIVNAVAKPNAYALQGEERMEISDSKYHFVQNTSGAVELTVTGRFAPSSAVKKFMLETWFPNGPADLIDRLVKSINAQ
ncbi:hypothetical protein BH09BAC1_BH09BAC1_23640 [soil metagenome]